MHFQVLFIATVRAPHSSQLYISTASRAEKKKNGVSVSILLLSHKHLSCTLNGNFSRRIKKMFVLSSRPTFTIS